MPKIDPRWFDHCWGDPLRPSDIAGIDQNEHPSPIWRRFEAQARDNHINFETPWSHDGCTECDGSRVLAEDCPCPCHLLERPEFDE